MDKTIKFVNTKIGYGNPKGSYWFIGPEEGGTIEGNKDRIETWSQLGANENFHDLKEFHLLLSKRNGFNSLQRFFIGEKIKLQSTWNGIIEVLFGIIGNDSLREERRVYQSIELGSKNGETIIGELFPFSSKKLNDETSKNYFGLSKKDYWEKFSIEREILLANQIEKYSPKIVVFYSTTFNSNWKRIIERLDTNFNNLQTHSDLPFSYHKTSKTLFVIIPHPIARQLNKKKKEVGVAIKKLI
ncbi:MAG: hypothetical protein EBT39_05395 [Sphingobacteriia bacterium]|nr:hypothetical protein [Candidatus Fonsibacter lacus]